MQKLNALTSFRFVAAFIVYLSHSISIFNDFHFGYVGVSFFFVLSGFILTYNYHSKFGDLNKLNIKKFYIARMAKIYPVYVLTLAISIPYIFMRHQISGSPLPALTDIFNGFIANLFMIHSFIPLPFGSTPYSFNLVSWSLSDEIFFYVLFPLLVFVLLKLKINRGVLQNLWTAIIFYIAIVCLTLMFMSIRGVKPDDWFFYVFPVFRSLDFIMGILMGLLFVTIQKQKMADRRSLFTFLELLALGLFVAWPILSPQISLAFRFSVYYLPMWCFLIFVFACQAGMVSRLLSHKWLVFLGEISFSFYMIHLLIINYFGFIPMSSVLNHLITFSGSIILSTVIYLKFEEPLRKKIRFGAKKEKRELEYQTVPL